MILQVAIALILGLIQEVHLAGILCPGLRGETVCPGREGIEYSDGCQTITCQANGYSSTDSDINYMCKEIETVREMKFCLDTMVSALSKTRKTTKRYITCSNLRPKIVCKYRSMRGMTYNDGCNYVICGSNRALLSTNRTCGIERGEDDKAYCHKLQKQYEKTRDSRVHVHVYSRKLQNQYGKTRDGRVYKGQLEDQYEKTTDRRVYVGYSNSRCVDHNVCRFTGVTGYFDGCNRCGCRSNICTQRYCGIYDSLSGEEFNEYCRKQRAGATGFSYPTSGDEYHSAE